MSETGDDLAVPTEEKRVFTFKELEEYPELIAGQNKAKEGILDDPEFEAHELAKAAVDLILFEEGAGAAAGGGAAEPEITRHQRKALFTANSLKGIREHPVGSNCNRYSSYFGLGCQEWCADFVSYCVDVTGIADTKAAVGPSVLGGQHHGLGKEERESLSPAEEGYV